jgi:hypothetical protein
MSLASVSSPRLSKEGLSLMNTRVFLTRGFCISILGVLAFGAADSVAGLPLQPGSPVPGVPDFIFSFDENGHGFFNGQPVPENPVTGGGIDYFLPVPVVPGDVIVNGPSDIGTTGGNGFSDLLTFMQGTTGGVLFYQSLADDSSAPDLADIVNLIAPTTSFAVLETGPEGNNGFVWNPLPSQTFYRGISDIPEPSTIVLGGLGLASLVALAYRRRRAAGTRRTANLFQESVAH